MRIPFTHRSVANRSWWSWSDRYEFTMQNKFWMGGERKRSRKKKTRQERMFVNKIAIVVKFHAAVKTESTCGCCFYRNLRVIGCFLFFFWLIFLIVSSRVFCLISVLVTANTFFYWIKAHNYLHFFVLSAHGILNSYRH